MYIYILSISKLVKIVFSRVLKVKRAVCESHAEIRSADLEFFALVLNRITAITHVVCVACAGSCIWTCPYSVTCMYIRNGLSEHSGLFFSVLGLWCLGSTGSIRNFKRAAGSTHA